MAVQIPLLPSEFNYRFEMSLLDIEYIFEVRWNGRDGTWYLSIFDIDENPLAQGMRIVLGAALGRRIASDDFPDGVFIVSDLTGSGEEASFDDLGTRVVVHFFSRAELS